MLSFAAEDLHSTSNKRMKIRKTYKASSYFKNSGSGSDADPNPNPTCWEIRFFKTFLLAAMPVYFVYLYRSVVPPGKCHNFQYFGQ